MKVRVEITDTFGHEPNYTWVKRHEFEFIDTLSHYALVRRVKAMIGWTGKRCVTVDYGDSIELRPQGECQVAFINFN